jgi:hypothetical protein
MHKRTSKRRWKARFRLGQWVPMFAVVSHQLRIDRSAVAYSMTSDHIRRLP